MVRRSRTRFLLAGALSLATALPGLGQRCLFHGFEAPIDLPGFPVVAGDFEEDGRLDLVARSAVGTSLLANRGAGRFEPKPLSISGAQPAEGAAGDFNGDGHLDLIATNGSNVAPLLGDGRGGFTRGQDFPASVSPGPVVVADFNGDGALDVVVAGFDPAAPGIKRMAFLEGDGGGGLGPPIVKSLEEYQGGGVTGLAAADLDGDGDADLAVSISGHHCGDSTVYLGDGSGGFARREGGLAGVRVALADFDEDGLPDLVGGCSTGSDGLLTTALSPPGATVAIHQILTIGGYGFYSGHVAGDFDGDGHADVLASSSAGTHLFRGDGRGTLAAGERLFLQERIDAAADLDGDGRPDLLTWDFRHPPHLLLNRCDASALDTTLLVPVVLGLTGAHGAGFRSEVIVTNRGDAGAVVESVFTPAFGTVANERGSTFLGSGEQLRSRDASFDLPAGPAPWAGTLRLRFSGLSSPDQVHALGMVRSTTDLGGLSHEGGVCVPAVPVSEALHGPSVIGWLRETPEDRTNLALVNAGEDGDVTLRVTVVSTDAAHPGATTLPDVTLPPGGLRQLDRVLASSGLGATGGFARIERVAGLGPYWAWATVNDNASADGSLVPALATGSNGATPSGFPQAPSGIRRREPTLTLPVLVESPTFTSELVVTNASEEAKRISFEWVADAVATADHAARFVLELGPREQVTIPSFVEWLRRKETPGIGPAGPTYAGALFASVDEGDVEGVLVGARTSAAGAAGRYGVFYAALSSDELASASAWLYGLEQDSTRRASIALVNAAGAGEGAATFRIDLFDGVSGRLAATIDDLRLEPRAFRQLSMVLAPYGLRNAYARITRTDGPGPFLAYAVVNDGASPGFGTGDGSFLPMRVQREAAASRP